MEALKFFVQEEQNELFKILHSDALCKEEKLKEVQRICECNDPYLYYEFEDYLNQESKKCESLYEIPSGKGPSLYPRITPERPPEQIVGLSENIYATLPNEINLLFLGATGTGKTTLINALVNYIYFTSIDRAITEGVRVLIRTRLTETTESTVMHPIVLNPNIRAESEMDLDNENIESGQSSTQFPRTYALAFGPPGRQKYIRIIDTPGIMDTRGVEVDKENFINIMNTLAGYDQIHAICILVPAHTSRVTLDFRYCVNQLLSHLHTDASRNIVFCFTKCRGVEFSPGESFSVLQRHLNTLNAEHNVWIQYNQLLSRVGQLQPLDTAGIVSVNSVRTAMMALARPLAAFTKLLIRNQELIDVKKEELQQCIADGSVLMQQLSHEEPVPVAQPLDHPVLVCTSPTCVEMRSLRSGWTYPYYKTVCHNVCRLRGIEPGTFPNPLLQKCRVFHRNKEQCFHCNCSWEYHMHINYQIVYEMRRCIDVQHEMENNKNQVKAAATFINKLNDRKKYYTEEVQAIQRMCAYFAAFLKSNSLLVYNDSYHQYMNLVIREEREKQTNPEYLTALEESRRSYLQMILVIEQADNQHLSVNMINEMIINLKTRQFHGNVLEEIQGLQVKAAREYQKETNEGAVDCGSLLDSTLSSYVEIPSDQYPSQPGPSGAQTRYPPVATVVPQIRDSPPNKDFSKEDSPEPVPLPVSQSKKKKSIKKRVVDFLKNKD